MTHDDREGARAIRTAFGGIAAGLDAATARAAAGINLGQTVILDIPLVTDLGTYTEEKLVDVCDPLEAITDETRPGCVVCLVQDTDGAVRQVQIGRTPAKFDPQRRGVLMAGAGDVGDFFMIVQEHRGSGAIGERTPGNPRYLDELDLTNVILTTNERFLLNSNPGRGENGRQIMVPGKITTIKILRGDRTPPTVKSF